MVQFLKFTFDKKKIQEEFEGFFSKLIWRENVELYVRIISIILAKFQKDQRLIAMLSMTCLNFKFLWLKIMHKKYIY